MVSDKMGSMEPSDLRLAIEHLELDRITLPLRAGADPNEPNPHGFSLLHHAIDIEHGAWFNHQRERTGEAVRLLLAAGAEVNARDHRGMTPLDLAIANQNSVVVQLLRLMTD